MSDDLMRQQIKAGNAEAQRVLTEKDYPLDPRIASATIARIEAELARLRELLDTCGVFLKWSENAPHGTETVLAQIKAALAEAQPAAAIDCHRLDTPTRVLFYENDFYVLSNFSAFRLTWRDRSFDTSEAAYHWAKFQPDDPGVANLIRSAPSAHEAFKIAEKYKSVRRADWDAIKVDVMRDILRTKMQQHEYVRLKLLATGGRELIEDSWRDDFWGWGPNRDGKNMLGKLWMEIRAEAQPASTEAVK